MDVPNNGLIAALEARLYLTMRQLRAEHTVSVRFLCERVGDHQEIFYLGVYSYEALYCLLMDIPNRTDGGVYLVHTDGVCEFNTVKQLG